MDRVQTFTTPSGDEMVILPKAEYDELVEHKFCDDDDADYVEAKRISRRVKEGKEPLIPFEIIEMKYLQGIPTLRAWRLYKKLSLAALAKKIGKSQPYLTQIENGTRKGSLQTMMKLAKALGTSVDCLVD
jgi:DNA-binding XRE family transcriptional regulator